MLAQVKYFVIVIASTKEMEKTMDNLKPRDMAKLSLEYVLKNQGCSKEELFRHYGWPLSEWQSVRRAMRYLNTGIKHQLAKSTHVALYTADYVELHNIKLILPDPNSKNSRTGRNGYIAPKRKNIRLDDLMRPTSFSFIQ
jgi:hypothetical protein